MMRFLYTLLFCFCLSALSWADASRYATSSVLAEGSWVKIQVDTTGIYKLTYDQLRSMGFSEPSQVSVHGYGGWIIDENFANGYIDDLPSVAVWRGDDYLLFYGKGTTKWEYNPTTQNFYHTNNHYSTSGYYFLTQDNTPRTMETVNSYTAGASTRISTFDDYLLHERDLVSPNESGRELFGESFVYNRDQTFPFRMEGITQDEAKVTLRFVSKVPSNATGVVNLSVNDQSLYSLAIQPPREYVNYTAAIPAENTGSWVGEKSEDIRVNITYGQSGHQNVNLDYIRIQAKRQLRPYGAYTFFRSIASRNNISRFVIQDATANTLVFDVTDCINPTLINTELNGSEMSFTIPEGELREFVIVQTNGSFPTPNEVGVVPNQNLHAMPQTKMVIIAPEAFRRQAERLGEEHLTRDGITYAVVNPNDIYNEFSSGTPDASAYRRLMKMLYDRKTSDADAPEYLLLFGDGVYDNRGITNDEGMSGIFNQYREQLLLTYQSQESLNIYSYVTDDYFGILDDANNGLQIYLSTQNISIGRLPVRTAQEAENVVSKLISYMDNTEVGAWKNRLSFVADDGSSSDNYTTAHMAGADGLATYIEDNHPEFRVNKVYFDAYRKDFSGDNTTYPSVINMLKEQFEEGLLVINYSGHGNTTSWSDERVLVQSDITQATYRRLPLWITATCDFTRFDSPITSAGEDVLLNSISGGIGLFSTTRAVFQGENDRLNRQLVQHLFRRENGQHLTLGQIMRNTKNSSELNSSNKLCFILIGDPALKLAYPDYQMEVTKVNGQPVSEGPFQFRALDEINIEGEVYLPDGSVAADFSGEVTYTLMDSRDTITTLNNNNRGSYQYTDYPYIQSGTQTVTNGTFNFSFNVPLGISYSGDFGKLNLYGLDETNAMEAQGAFLDFRVGGTNENAGEDSEGPEIRSLFLNDSTFVDGGKVNTTPLLYAYLWDRSGINTSNSLGHEITLIIDGRAATTYNLNNYYSNTARASGEGQVVYSIPALEPGIHTAEFIVWDIRHNSTNQTFTFEVVEGLKPNIYEILATPNPARDQVEFRLRHDRPSTNIDVQIMVYDMTGRRIWQHQESGSSELFKSYIVTWNLANSFGSRVRPGVYIYRAAVRSNNSKEATKANKLIILGQ